MLIAERLSAMTRRSVETVRGRQETPDHNVAQPNLGQRLRTEPLWFVCGSVALRSTRRATYNDLSDTVTRDCEESGRPGSNWHHQLGRLRFYH